MVRKFVLWLAVSLLLLLCSCSTDASPSDQKVVLFGDSNTAGSNWPARHFDPSLKWANQLQKAYPHVTFINAGISGNTTDMARDRFQKDVLAKKPDLVFIMFGTNDAVITANGHPRVSKQTFRENLQYFVDQLKKSGAKPVLMTCTPLILGDGHHGYYNSKHLVNLYPENPRSWQNSYNDITREVAKKNNVTLIDFRNKVVEKAGDATDQKLIQSGLVDASGTHMTPKGAKYLFQLIQNQNLLQ